MRLILWPRVASMNAPPPCSIHGLTQVSKAAFESCDLGATPIKQWTSGCMGGAVSIELAEGSTYYFIDPVLTNCAQGYKAQVQLRGHVCEGTILHVVCA